MAQVDASGTAWIVINPETSLLTELSPFALRETGFTVKMNVPPSNVKVWGGVLKMTLTFPPWPDVTLPVIKSTNVVLVGDTPGGALNETRRLK